MLQVVDQPDPALDSPRPGWSSTGTKVRHPAAERACPHTPADHSFSIISVLQAKEHRARRSEGSHERCGLQAIDDKEPASPGGAVMGVRSTTGVPSSGPDTTPTISRQPAQHRAAAHTHSARAQRRA